MLGRHFLINAHVSVIFILIIFLQGCNKFVEVSSPPNQLQNADVFSSDADATSLMTGIYTRMMSSNGFASGSIQGVTQLAGLSSDEFINFSTDPNQAQFANNSLTSNNPTLNNGLWSEIYKYIYTSNLILEGLNGKNGLSAPVSQQLTGEAKFVRAFCYFYLVNLFGDVPLYLSSNYQANAVSTRTASTVVYQQIVADLNDAQNLMASDYSNSGGQRVRPNKWTASAMLARVYLYEQKWDSAEVEANSVIANSSLFSLTSLDSVFLANSSEAIWQLLPVKPNQNTNEAQSFIFLTTPPFNVALDSVLINTFESGDQRFVNWIGNFTDGTDTWYFPYKYKVQSSPVLIEYSMVLRLAEQYLIKAEAAANGAGNGVSEAINSLNTIRQRAGLPSYSGLSDIQSVLKAIYHERQVELFCEWGHRWLDLIRTGNANEVLGAEKTPWMATDTLYPIPSIEIQNNSRISQNPGY